MTVLYRLDADAAAIGRAFAAAAGADPWAGGVVAIGGFAPVITAGRDSVAGPRAASQPRRLVPRLWGVPPPAAAGVGPHRGIAMVRTPDSPFWIGHLRNAEFRCLVPASAFMVWGREHAARARRRQLWVGCADQPLFAFAGVWKDSEVPSFALLSTEPNAVLRGEGHAAMPAILPADPAAHQRWLWGDWREAVTLLQPYPSGMTTGG